MSLKTHENQGFAVLTTFDGNSIFLTEDEFAAFEMVIQNPNTKFLNFEDGGIALSDIRRYELIKKPVQRDRQLEEPELIPVEEPMPTPEQVRLAREKAERELKEKIANERKYD